MRMANGLPMCSDNMDPEGPGGADNQLTGGGPAPLGTQHVMVEKGTEGANTAASLCDPQTQDKWGWIGYTFPPANSDLTCAACMAKLNEIVGGVP